MLGFEPEGTQDGKPRRIHWAIFKDIETLEDENKESVIDLEQVIWWEIKRKNKRQIEGDKREREQDEHW